MRFEICLFKSKVYVRLSLLSLLPAKSRIISLSMGTQILARGLIGSFTSCIPNTSFASPSLVTPFINLVLGASYMIVYRTNATNKLNFNLEIVVDHFKLLEHVLVANAPHR